MIVSVTVLGIVDAVVVDIVVVFVILVVVVAVVVLTFASPRPESVLALVDLETILLFRSIFSC